MAANHFRSSCCECFHWFQVGSGSSNTRGKTSRSHHLVLEHRFDLAHRRLIQPQRARHSLSPVWTRRPTSPDYLKWFETSSFEYLALLWEIVQKTRAKEANRPWQPNSLVIRRAKLNNGLPFKHVYHVPACDFDETWGAMLGERSLWPPYLGPSVSIRQHNPPRLHDPSPLGCQHPHVYSIIT